MFARNGVALHRNAALRGLLAEDQEGDRIERAIGAVARALCAGGGKSRKSAPPLLSLPAAGTLRTGGGSYLLFGAYLPVSELPGRVLVAVEREGLPLPSAAHLMQRWGLTRRQAEVARLLARGMTDKAVATKLGITRHTARRHTERVLSKLGVQSRAAVASRLISKRG